MTWAEMDALMRVLFVVYWVGILVPAALLSLVVLFGLLDCLEHWFRPRPPPDRPPH